MKPKDKVSTAIIPGITDPCVPRTTLYSWLAKPPESPLRCCLRPLGTALSATPSCTKTRGERMLLGFGGGSGRLRAEATVSAASSPVLVCVCEVRVCARAPSAARPGARSALGGSLFRFSSDSRSIFFSILFFAFSRGQLFEYICSIYRFRLYSISE